MKMGRLEQGIEMPGYTAGSATRAIPLASTPALALVLLLAAAVPGQAASFDCKKAAQPLEKAICNDAELSKLDEDLAASYAKAKAALSPDGQKILLTGQHDWLAFSRRICKTRLDPKIAKLVEQTPADCLKSEYRERIEDLDAAATVVNGFTFGTVDTYDLSPSDPQEPGARPGFSYQRLSWPRIDAAPAGLSPDIWNKAIEAAARKLASGDGDQPAADSGDQAAAAAPATDASKTAGSDAPGSDAKDGADTAGEDVDIAFNLGLVTPQLISVELTYSVYGHGAAHPGGSSQVQNLFLADGHALTEKDLFRPDQDWLTFMTKKSHDAWLKIMEDAPDQVDDKAIADVIKDTTCWLLTDKGISVLFPLYSVGPYVVGEQQVDFTWDELKPYLVDKLPFDRG
jgi:uncharacterized protein